MLETYKQNGQSIILVLGHLGNWEWGGGYLSLQNIPKLYAIYHPLANPQFDRLMIHMRTRLGAGVYPMKQALRGMLKNKKAVTSTAFISDQAPGRENAHWMTFLNQKTAVFQGTEIIARKLDYPVVYVSVQRQKRGYYNLHCELLTEHPQSLAGNELTEMHTRRLEQDIIEQPETWLWTHRRWKQRRKRKPQ
jgi:KDO2-lipid IV(A) lauroyltransferase